MKTIRLFLLVLFISTFAAPATASHLVGLRITYEYNGSGYIFKLKLYRDCAGIQAPTSPIICFNSLSGCSPAFTATLIMDTANSGFEVPFNSCAAVGATYCQGGNIFAFEEYNYTAFVAVPQCDDWVVSYDECCRNAAITNLVDPDFYNAHVETRFDNLNFPTNSSPQFNAVPLNYYCAGIPAIVDYSAYDLDGDSLSYEFTVIQGGGCSSPVIIPFNPPYTYDQPLATLAPTVFDPYTGQISFIPSAIQISVIGFKVNEYRNGVLIGSVRRDDEIVVVGAMVNPDTIAGSVFYDLNTNGIFDGSDYPAAGVMVHMGPGNSYNPTLVNGKYLFQTIPGNFNVDIPVLPLYTTCTPASIAVNTTGPGSFFGQNDFALQLVPNMNDLEVSLNSSPAPIPGFGFPLFITYQNSGTTSQSAVEIQLTLDSETIYQSATPAPSNVNGNVLTWNFATLNMFSGGTISVLTDIDTTATIGDTVFCTVTISSTNNDNTPLNNIDVLTEPVLNSCDPNSKEVVPEGELSPAFISNQDYLHYTIHYQNLGTAPANLIRIQDLLDADLDLGTFEVVGASKPTVTTFTNPNKIEFMIYNASLPPASVNEPGSHGFIEFRIRPKSGLQPGTILSNGARIYFDFNPPIFTNIVYNTIPSPTGIQQVESELFDVLVYPNPASDRVIVELTTGRTDRLSLQLYDVMGKKVSDMDMLLQSGFNSIELPVKQLSNGIYFMRLRSGQTSYETKIIRN